ncbi:MAG: 6-pyruvoyl-tetrahydropterin synthase-related protein, partial [bacterium]|nr:6-pyruvoyl-tetrahydropterin synthase-related protein [bacterium]
MTGFLDPENKHYKPVYPVLLLFFLMLWVAWYKWIILGGYAAPPGSDGGQWLAFGHQLFTGETVKAGFQSYPPLLPSIVKIVSSILTPLGALKLTGIFTSVFIAIPVYLILRRTLIPVIAIVLAIIATLTPFNGEVLSFGGYPQLLGSSFLLFSLYFLTLGFETRGKRWFFAASLAASATIGSNIFPSFLLIIASLLIVLFYLFRMRCESKAILYHRIRSAFLCWVLPSIVLVIPFIKSYFAYLSESASS